MFIRPVGVTVRSADRPAGHPLLRGLLARATGTEVGVGTGTVDTDEPRHGVRWRTSGPIEPEPVEAEAEAVEAEAVEAAEAEAEAGPVESAKAEEPEGVRAGGLVAELTQLAALAREGLLTPQEFATAKGRLLRG
ncbi:hypothetical protein OG625_12395 [Streptomyces sp. NBC_01351]|uniref:hypothetical protein n=1 Tax=Streptomyces sp. NBC_01351 TaxID=2903833 RepID=UPI002E305514|nr:hypothetical protein [Streptomyces sp. NBC_01351]